MLIIIQFPVFDVRRFQPAAESRMTSVPDWGSLQDEEINRVFIRSIGVLRNRDGGNSGGEDRYASAKKAIRFPKLPFLEYNNATNQKELSNGNPIFRRFFFDGQASGKYEIGFLFHEHKKKQIDEKVFLKYVQNLLSSKVTIPIFKHENRQVTTSLITAGKYLAEQYLKATTLKFDKAEAITGVYAGVPCILIERLESEDLKNAFSPTSVNLGEFKGVKLNYFTFNFQDTFVKVWETIIKKDTAENISVAREFRIALLKLNAFRATLQFVLRQISADKLLPKRDTREAGDLNFFIKKCFSSYLKPKFFPDQLKASDYQSLVLSFEDAISGGARAKLYENLRRVIEIRRNYFNGIIEYLEQQDKAMEENKKTPTTIFNIVGDGNNLNVAQGNITQNINDSFNTIKGSDAPAEMKDLLNKLTKKVQGLVAQKQDDEDVLPKETQLELTNNLKEFTEHATDPKAAPEKVKESSSTFTTVLKTLGVIGGPLIQLVTKIVGFF